VHTTLVTVACPLPATAGTLHLSTASPQSTAFQAMHALRVRTQSVPLYSCSSSLPSSSTLLVSLTMLLLASPHLLVPPMFHGHDRHRLHLRSPRRPTSVRIAPLVSASNLLRSSTHHVNPLLSSCSTATCSAYLPTLLNRSYFGSSALSCSNHRHASHDILTLFVSLLRTRSRSLSEGFDYRVRVAAA